MKLWLTILIAFTMIAPALAQDVHRDIPYASSPLKKSS